MVVLVSVVSWLYAPCVWVVWFCFWRCFLVCCFLWFAVFALVLIHQWFLLFSHLCFVSCVWKLCFCWFVVVQFGFGFWLLAFGLWFMPFGFRACVSFIMFFSSRFTLIGFLFFWLGLLGFPVFLVFNRVYHFFNCFQHFFHLAVSVVFGILVLFFFLFSNILCVVHWYVFGVHWLST